MDLFAEDGVSGPSLQMIADAVGITKAAFYHQFRTKDHIVIDMAVRDRRLVRTLQFDPVVLRLLAEHEPFQRFMSRLYRVLLGEAADDNLIQVAMLSGAISSAVRHPLVGDIDDGSINPTEMNRTLARIDNGVVAPCDERGNPT